MPAGSKPLTFSQIRDAKRQWIHKHRAAFAQKLKASPKAVQDEYRLCIGRIARLLRRRGKDGKVDATIYPAKGRAATLAGFQVAWLLDLLSHPANGWQVSLSKPLGGEGDGEVKILFRFDPHED